MHSNPGSCLMCYIFWLSVLISQNDYVIYTTTFLNKKNCNFDELKTTVMFLSKTNITILKTTKLMIEQSQT